MTKTIDKTPSTENVNVTIKSMKSSSDVVNFYRFIVKIRRTLMNGTRNLNIFTKC